MQRHGWTLLFHGAVIEQLRKLHTAVQRAERNDPHGFEGNANVRLFRALSQLILEVVPSDPARSEFRQGNTLGAAHRHWRRAKIGRRFRLFFRYDSKSKVIVYAWVNDEETLRSAGSKSDPYAVFAKMLAQGNPPDDWAALVGASKGDCAAEATGRD
jgi:toxin YhaV